MNDNASSWRALREQGYAGRLTLLCFGVWLHAADSLMVATVIPEMIADIGGAKLIAWTFALYEIGSIVAGASSALIILKFGARLAMSSAALLYMLGCVISAIAPDMPVLLAGRLLQGLGGGALIAISFVSVMRIFPRALVPRAIAAMSLIWGVSAFTGPLVGGVFAELHFWRGAFWFFAAQAIALAVWILLSLRDENDGRTGQGGESFPGLRLLLLSTGVVAIAAAGIDVDFVKSSILIFSAVVLLTVFLRVDSRAGSNRLLPNKPFNLRTKTGAALVMIFCFTVSTVAITIYGPILMTVLYNASALTAGYIIALSSIGWSVLAVGTSGMPERHDRKLIFCGMCVLAGSTAGFIYAVPNGPLGLIAFFAFLDGAGFGMSWTFILRRLTAVSEKLEHDRIASALPTVQRFGYATGAACMGIIANAVGFSDSLKPATAEAVGFWIFVISLLIAVAGLAACWIFLRGERLPAS